MYKEIVSERIYLRTGILENLYALWFKENPMLVTTKEMFYQHSDIEQHRAIVYLLDKGYIAVTPLDDSSDEITITITTDGIDAFEKRVLEDNLGWGIILENTKED